MFRVKICGITSVADALLAVSVGADAIGLNFYPRSVRFLTADKARAIVKALPERVLPVGVFVNASVEEVLRIAEQTGVQWAQLHGDEIPETAVAVRRKLPVMRAFRYRAETASETARYLSQCAQLDGLPTAVLLDAYRPGEYGGTGQTLDWQAVRDCRPHLLNCPLTLAGGLTAENVAQAIETARPDGVDTASGVESAPGIKDAGKVQAFVAAAREAFGRLKPLT